jgi:nitrous oxidase accessory protein NosD
MKHPSLLLRAALVCVTVTVAGAGVLATTGAAGATPVPNIVYVGPAGVSAGPVSCRTPNYTSIQPAIEAVGAGGVVVVCRGTYPGMVNVDQRITLAGNLGATINATGDVYGIGVSASGSFITGMKVIDASPYNPNDNQLADGIVTIAIGAHGPAAANDVTISHNVVTGNLGSGIDINSSSNSTATFNVATDNGVGINVSDDLDLPADHNMITFNVTDKNFGGCGIALADHTGAGVSDNTVAYNRSDDNGLATATAPDASAGSGVIMASPIPGGIVMGNTITLNEFSGNGHGGVVVHAHAPGDNFSGNSVTSNMIGTNNVRTDENDLKTTGVYLGSASPLSIKVANNIIGPDYYGIFASGSVTITGGNSYVGVNTEIGTFPTF